MGLYVSIYGVHSYTSHLECNITYFLVHVQILGVQDGSRKKARIGSVASVEVRMLGMPPLRQEAH